MSKESKVVYLYKWIVQSYKTIDNVEAAKHTKRLLDKVFNAYQKAQTSKDYSKISYKCIYHAGKQDQVEKLLIIDELRFKDDILFGSVGITNKTLDSMVRQRDEKTMEHSELSLSSPSNSWEFYTFFAIHAVQRRLLILRNSDMPRNLHILLANACQNALGDEPYNFLAELFSEEDLKSRLKEMKHIKIDTMFALHEKDLNGKPSIQKLSDVAEDRKSTCRLTCKLSLKQDFTDKDVDEIIEISQDADCKRFKILEGNGDSTSNDSIDLLKLLVQAKREVFISSQQAKNPDIVYKEFLGILGL